MRNDDDLSLLLRHDATPHAVSLEDYVAYQATVTNTLGARHGAKRDRITIEWLEAEIAAAEPPVRVLDVGCSYGHHIFMLNAAVGKPRDIEMVGVDLFGTAIDHANAFACSIPGYANCSFQVADLAKGLPFEDSSFSVVNLADVLEHMVDPAAALRELIRVCRPGSMIVISTPLRESVYKRIARAANRLSGGGIYRRYYEGKGATLDESGEPLMATSAGHDHVSEMALAELVNLFREVDLAVERLELMSVMSGSEWFDGHPALLSGLLLIEALHEKLKRPSWAHAAMFALRVQGA